MSSIMRARSALTGRSEEWEVIEASSLKPKVAGPSMLGIGCPDRHVLPLTPAENAWTVTHASSRESGFVLGREPAIRYWLDRIVAALRRFALMLFLAGGRVLPRMSWASTLYANMRRYPYVLRSLTTRRYRSRPMTISHRLFRNLYISVLGHYVTTAFVAILLSFFTYYFAVLQKTIVNKGIVGRHFPQLFFGREFEQVPYLTVLCSILLVLGLTLVGLRWLTRRQQQKFGARLTEAMVRRVADVEAPPQIMVRDIEYAQAFDELHSRYIPTFSQPILGGITLISLAFFIFIQDPILGAASVTTFPMRGFFTKRIRRRLSSPSAVPSSDAPGVRAFVLNATRMAETRRQFDLLSRYVTLFLV